MMSELARKDAEGGPAPLLYKVAIGVAILAGIVLRSNRYWFDPIGFWGDEGIWANKLFTVPISDMLIRPVGFMAINKGLAGIYTDVRVLRLLPYLAGVASLFVAVYVGHRLFRSWVARFLLVFVVAFHPGLIDLAKEFKPYSVDFFAHLGLVAVYLRYVQTRRPAWMYTLLGLSGVAFLFSYNIVFLLPVLFLLLAIEQLQARTLRRLSLVAGGAVLALAVILGVYWESMSKMNVSKQKEFWGKKYDVFYLEETHRNRLSQTSWTVDKYLSLADAVGLRRARWMLPESASPRLQGELRDFDKLGWIALHVLGIAALIHWRRWRELALLAGPVLISIPFNVIGLWPFGAFRTNLFYMAYFIPLGMYSVDLFATRARPAREVLSLCVCGFIVFPALFVARDWHSRKATYVGHTEAPSVLSRLRQLHSERPGSAASQPQFVIVDWELCRASQYYLGYDDTVRRMLGEAAVRELVLHCAASAKAADNQIRRFKSDEFWLVLSTRKRNERFLSTAKRVADLVSQENVRGAHDIYHFRKKSAD